MSPLLQDASFSDKDRTPYGFKPEAKLLKPNHFLRGSSQPLLCYCLHLRTRLTNLLEISTKKYLITKLNSWAVFKIVYEVRKQSMAGMETLLKTYALSKEDKWRRKHLGALGIMSETAS